MAHELPGVNGTSPVVSAAGAGSTHAGIRKALSGLLQEYFAGRAVNFDLDTLPLWTEDISPFSLRVYRALAAVPRGQTVTYADLAAAAGSPGAARAVGNAMAANPWPVIVPCHRVIRSDGSLGGFSSGTLWKRRLLELESFDVESF